MSGNILPGEKLLQIIIINNHLSFNSFCTLCATKGQVGELIYHVENLTFTSANVSTNKWLLFLQMQRQLLESSLCSLLKAVVAAGVNS